MALSNEEYGMIMREYDRRQAEAHRRLLERTEEVYAADPSLRALDGEIAAVSLRAAKAAARLRTEEKTECQNELELLRRQKAGRIRRAGFPENYLDPVYICPKCRDTGYVGREKCQCFHKMEAALYLEESNLKDVLEEENFTRYTDRYYDERLEAAPFHQTVREHMHGIYLTCVRYTENFRAEGGNLVLMGPAGTGKTFFTHCIAAELLRQGCGVLYYTASELMNLFSASRFDSREQPDAAERCQRLFSCDLLIIDDLGTEWINALSNSELFNCLNERLRMKKSCVISTNLDLKGLKDRYTERVASRIIGNYQILELTGSDIRIRKNLGKR